MTYQLSLEIKYGWLVVLGLTALGESIPFYIRPSPRERAKEERKVVDKIKRKKANRTNCKYTKPFCYFYTRVG